MGNSPRDMLKDLSEIQRSVNRLADDIRLYGGTWSPPADVFESSDAMIVEVEVPEVKPENMEITLQNNKLTLRGERRFMRNRNNERYHRVERCYGVFSRVFNLPFAPDPEGINVVYEKGVLTIKVPRHDSEARKIRVK